MYSVPWCWYFNEAGVCTSYHDTFSVHILYSVLLRPHICPVLSSLVQEKHGYTGKKREMGCKKHEGTGAPDIWRKLKRNCDSVIWRKQGSGVILSFAKCISAWRDGVKIEAGSLQWCPVRGCEAIDSLKYGKFHLNIRKHHSLWKNSWGQGGWALAQLAPGGCGHVPKPIRTLLWAAWSRWPCLSRVAGPDNLQKSLPTSAILWYWYQNQCIVTMCWTNIMRLKLCQES